MWKDSIRNIVVIFQPNILRIVAFYVRHSAKEYTLKFPDGRVQEVYKNLTIFNMIHWVAGTDDSSTRRLMFQVTFFFSENVLLTGDYCSQLHGMYMIV